MKAKVGGGRRNDVPGLSLISVRRLDPCSLHSVFVDIERHTSEPGVPAGGVNSLRTFHAGKVVALTCLRPLSNEIGESGGVLITGGRLYLRGGPEAVFVAEGNLL